MLHVVLVEPEIPWNTGNAARTCLAAGARLHLVKPLGFSLEEKRIRRAGLDYWRYVEPAVHESFAALESVLPALGEPFFFCAGAPRSLYQAEIPADAVFLFGSESVGFHAEVRAAWSSRLVGLPMADARVRSLNLSTAVGVAVYEAFRRTLAAAAGGCSAPAPEPQP